MAQTELEHGGRLRAAARRYGIAPNCWLDLSTGINPHPWPRPSIPDGVWQCLPDDEDGLIPGLRRTLDLGAEVGITPLAGSQAAIRLIPRLRHPCRVAVPAPGYAEHGLAWKAAGHEVTVVSADTIEQRLPEVDVLVWIQPNNPTGEIIPPERLLQWHRQLVARDGWLLVDEAFIDVAPEASLQTALGRPGLLVLRSLGKFFGLAGVRAGLLLGDAGLCRALALDLGPWAVSGPARYLLGRALADRAWQEPMRRRLRIASARLQDLLAQKLGVATHGTDLFRYWPEPRAAEIQDALGREAILVRRFEHPSALRIGLPATEVGWARLADALEALR
ncbi:threonine-phosphate decarboxylase CobD [Methylonatrum kenyense]|uniref:threonine-phosphate decarboxylase CobD n=1 Tax=Methylonatrum kenyense TaxID=455253 RepID=UPI0020BF505D|nr:threonine-phosphate decarboxylase CobD [Methylonatrum kenyense]MCK8515377.1 threonine-phosphate decarboxylase CobD [Methylonatrum kenyense]